MAGYLDWPCVHAFSPVSWMDWQMHRISWKPTTSRSTTGRRAASCGGVPPLWVALLLERSLCDWKCHQRIPSCGGWLKWIGLVKWRVLHGLWGSVLSRIPEIHKCSISDVCVEKLPAFLHVVLSDERNAAFIWITYVHICRMEPLFELIRSYGAIIWIN